MAQPLSDAERKPATRTVVLDVPDEGPPLACNIAAAIFSFFNLMVLDFLSAQYFGNVSPTMESTWVLLMDLLPYGGLVNAVVGSIVMTVLAVSLQIFQRGRRFPDWLPLVLAWPAAWVLVAPSALQHSDDWAPWFIIGALAAFVFCCHWLCLMLAREAWD